MKLVATATFIFVSLVTSGCSVDDDPFSDEPKAEILDSVMILTSDGYMKNLQSYEISPDGKIYSSLDKGNRSSEGGTETYREIAEELSPLRHYSGTAGTIGDWGKKIECEYETEDNRKASIHWEGAVIAEITNSRQPDVSEFLFNCGSEKSKAAQKRIADVVELMKSKVSEYEQEGAK